MGSEALDTGLARTTRPERHAGRRACLKQIGGRN